MKIDLDNLKKISTLQKRRNTEIFVSVTLFQSIQSSNLSLLIFLNSHNYYAALYRMLKNISKIIMHDKHY
jgi:hypothetical protein